MLMPIFIKVSAINKLTRESLRFRRVKINDNYFGNVLCLSVLIVILFLVAWTVLDPPLQDTDYTLETDDDGDEFLLVHIGCASNSNAWEMAAFGWEFLVLASATVLTYQSREFIEELNESYWLTFMVYSLFLFMVCRLVVTSLMFIGTIPSALALRINSLILSVDSLLALCIYFCPKFYKALKNNGASSGSSNNQSRHRGRNSISSIESRISHNSRMRPRSSISDKNPKTFSRKISGINLPRTLSGRIPRLINKTPDGSQHSLAQHSGTRSDGEKMSSNRLRRSSSGSQSNSMPRRIAELNIPLTEDGRVPSLINKESELSQESEPFLGRDSLNTARRSSGNSIVSFSGSRHSLKKETSASSITGSRHSIKRRFHFLIYHHNTKRTSNSRQ